MRTPDFLLIGAMKCGTSTLAAQLGVQDGLFMTHPKEPNYFSDDAVFSKGPKWYGSLFEKAEPYDICGEASTHYTKRPDFPQTLARIRAMLPSPRLVYMIRDPLARLVSHYMHDWSQGLISCSLEEAIKKQSSLIDYGRYGWQITPFVEKFGSDAVLLTSLERVIANPGDELARVAAHIGYSGSTVWVPEESTKNTSAERYRKLPLHRFTVENPAAATLRRLLVPKQIRARIRNSRKLPRPALPEVHRPMLTALFAEDRELLARHFPGDPSLVLAYPFLRE